MDDIRDFIRRLPKAELHLHLEGTCLLYTSEADRAARLEEEKSEETGARYLQALRIRPQEQSVSGPERHGVRPGRRLIARFRSRSALFSSAAFSGSERIRSIAPPETCLLYTSGNRPPEHPGSLERQAPHEEL